MTVEFLFWEGCPSHPKALAELREAMRELGLDEADISVREVSSESDAERERFVGSPTIRIDGVDIQQAENEPYGLSCRVYYRRDGRVSPTPDPQDVHDALLAAKTKRGGGPPNPEPVLDTGSLNNKGHRCQR
ncbi:MAG TPA: hypothetical protein VNU24_01680 [Solirubrobacteraceae bacterium]|nr:hypothetical protein [Solirubrobacteraceae bacterium]